MLSKSRIGFVERPIVTCAILNSPISPLKLINIGIGILAGMFRLAKALLIYETLTGNEIEDLINKNLYPKNKEDLKVEENDQSSALGSIGLKPKIVH